MGPRAEAYATQPHQKDEDDRDWRAWEKRGSNGGSGKWQEASWAEPSWREPSQSHTTVARAPAAATETQKPQYTQEQWDEWRGKQAPWREGADAGAGNSSSVAAVESGVAWQDRSGDAVAAANVVGSASAATAGTSRDGAMKPQCNFAMNTLVERYIETLPRDSFTVHSEKDWCTFVTTKGLTQAQIQLPAACGTRRRFRSSWCSSGDEAHTEVSKQVLDFLMEKGQIDKEFNPILASSPVFTEVKWPFTPASSGFRADDYSLDAWKAEPLYMYVVQVQKYQDHHTGAGPLLEKSPYAFLTSIPIRFNYQLLLDSPSGEKVILRLQAIDKQDDHTIVWNSEDEDAVREFHGLVTLQEDSIVVAVVKLTESTDQRRRCIDIAGMSEGMFAKKPDWLFAAHARVEHFQQFEAQIALLPSIPTPCSLKMWAVFDGGLDTRDAQMALSEIGAGTLALMATLSAYTVNPWDDAKQLERRANALIDINRIASLFVKSSLPEAFSRRHLKDPDEAATQFRALAGAHFLDGDFFAVYKLWRRLTDSDELKPALLYVGGSKPLRCHTDSYTELWEGQYEHLIDMIPRNSVSAEVIKREQPDEVFLLVRYVESGSALYRRSGQTGEELVLGKKGQTWMAVVWNPRIGSFCSPGLKNSECEPKPFPNKVGAWLRGKSFACFARWKRIRICKEAIPRYVSLRESCDETTGSSILYVRYEETRLGVVQYRRGLNGGLGTEELVVDGRVRVRAVGFSEANKTLVSMCLRPENADGCAEGCPLPQRLCDWLLSVRSLPQVVVGARKDSSPDCAVEDLGLEVSWTTTSDDRTYVCKADLTTAGWLYVGRVERAQEGAMTHSPWEGLTYSEERKEWEITFDGQPVPAKAITILTRAIEDAGKVDITSARLASAPWLEAPSVTTLVKQVPNMNLTEIELKLQHKFRNPQHLVEALTHGSVLASATPSFERLAVIGESAVQHYIARKLADCARFPMARTALAPTTAKEFATPHEVTPWADVVTLTEDVAPQDDELAMAAASDNYNIMQQKKDACCNHVSYAYMCVKLGLHTALQHSGSAELRTSIKHFARIAERGERGDEQPPKLVELAEVGGAPRCLGDAFLACVGAITLDGVSGTAADTLLGEHLMHCAAFADDRIPSLAKAAKLDEQASHEKFLEAVSRAGPAIGRAWTLALAPPPPSEGEEMTATTARPETDQRELAKVLSDVNAREINGELYVGVSPRAMELSASRSGPGSGAWEPRDEDAGAAAEEGSSASEASDAAGGRREDEPQDGAVYCQDCEMWLNGPTQWEDHKFGKKHKKNLQRKLQAGGEIAPRAKTASKMRPPPPKAGSSERPDHLKGGGETPAPVGGDAGGSEPQPHTGPSVSEQEHPWAAHPWAGAPNAGFYDYQQAMGGPMMPAYFPAAYAPMFMGGAGWGSHPHAEAAYANAAQMFRNGEERMYPPSQSGSGSWFGAGASHQ